MAEKRRTAQEAQKPSKDSEARIEITTETIFPIVFYARTSEDSGVEIVAVSHAGNQYIFRLSKRQTTHLASDLSSMEFKQLIKLLP